MRATPGLDLVRTVLTAMPSPMPMKRNDEPSLGPDLKALAVAARNGDSAAQDLLYDAAGLRLSKMALALGIPPDEVPDIIQEVLLSAWRNLEQFDPEKGSFISWLIPGLRGRAHNRLRAMGRREQFLQNLKALMLPQGGHARQPHEAVEARLTLQKLLGTLTDRQRDVVALYEIEGLSAKETAQLLGMSEAGVRSIARDARRRLTAQARRLEEREGEEFHGRQP